MKFVISNVQTQTMPDGTITETATLTASNIKPGAQAGIARFGADLASALADGKISAWEGMELVVDLTQLKS